MHILVNLCLLTFWLILRSFCCSLKDQTRENIYFYIDASIGSQVRKSYSPSIASSFEDQFYASFQCSIEFVNSDDNILPHYQILPLSKRSHDLEVPKNNSAICCFYNYPVPKSIDSCACISLTSQSSYKMPMPYESHYFYFLPDEDHMAYSLLKFFENRNWSLISIIYSNSRIGVLGKLSFTLALKKILQEKYTGQFSNSALLSVACETVLIEGSMEDELSKAMACIKSYSISIVILVMEYGDCVKSINVLSKEFDDKISIFIFPSTSILEQIKLTENNSPLEFPAKRKDNFVSLCRDVFIFAHSI